MDVYRRYFKVTTGPLVDAVKEANDINAEARKKYEALLKDLGAKSTKWYHNNNSLSGIIFDSVPDRGIYKKTKFGWWPKKNTKEGKVIHAKLEEIETRDLNSCLKVVNLDTWPRLFGNGRVYYAVLTVMPSDPLVAYISVPWYDEDPEKLRKYVEEKKTTVRGDINMDAILWEPTEDMVPVKKWEVDKAIDEWNESVKKEA